MGTGTGTEEEEEEGVQVPSRSRRRRQQLASGGRRVSGSRRGEEGEGQAGPISWMDGWMPSSTRPRPRCFFDFSPCVCLRLLVCTTATFD